MDKGFAEYLPIFSSCEASSVVQPQLTKQGKLEMQYSLKCSCTAENLRGLPSHRDLAPIWCPGAIGS